MSDPASHRRPGRAVTVVLLAVLLPLCAAASPAATLLVLGDSLSAGYGVPVDKGWVALLARRLGARECPWQVVNASISGDTTSGGAARLPAALRTHSPDVVVLELGGNDALRGQPLDLVRANLERMIRIAREAGSELLLLGMRVPPNYGPVYSEGFESVYRELHERHELAFVPFFLERVALDPALMQDDGIHPTTAAQPLMLETVWPVLAPLLQRVAPC
jgi:acyl-CoA thioesterase-1